MNFMENQKFIHYGLFMNSFNPAVKCPHCGKTNKPSITGWGREGLNGRLHVCKHCNAEYTVICFVETNKDYKISDIHLSAIKSRIKVKIEAIINMEIGLVNINEKFAKEYMRLEASKNRQN